MYCWQHATKASKRYAYSWYTYCVNFQVVGLPSVSTMFRSFYGARPIALSSSTVAAEVFLSFGNDVAPTQFVVLARRSLVGVPRGRLRDRPLESELGITRYRARSMQSKWRGFVWGRVSAILVMRNARCGQNVTVLASLERWKGSSALTSSERTTSLDPAVPRHQGTNNLGAHTTTKTLHHISRFGYDSHLERHVSALTDRNRL
jgi:hypothetical protein